MNSPRANWSFVTLLVALVHTGFADEPPGTDDLASEFKGAKLMRLEHVSNGDSFQCRLFTDAEHKKMQAEFKTSTKPPGNRALWGTYLILEVKKDRLVLLPEIWTDNRKIRVIPLRYISDVERAGLYAELPK